MCERDDFIYLHVCVKETSLYIFTYIKTTLVKLDNFCLSAFRSFNGQNIYG